jgi:hypothetical protein
MTYQWMQWKKTTKNRTDLTNLLTHLTRPKPEYPNPTDLLIKILNERTLLGSTEGYIVGNQKVVCFQDAPLYAIAENAINHIEEIEQNGVNKLRYFPCGLAFPKDTLYTLVAPDNSPISGSGARPVIYEKTGIAKDFLPDNQHWRIVDFEISNTNNITDWTYEREWRLKGDLTFHYNLTTVLLRDSQQYREFVKKVDYNILTELGGIVCLDTLLY